MFPSITSGAINAIKSVAQPVSNAAQTRLLNHFVVPQLLRGMQLLHPQGMFASQSRSVVTMQTAQAINQHLGNANQRIHEHFSFQKPNQSQSNTEAIQKKMIAALAETNVNADELPPMQMQNLTSIRSESLSSQRSK